MAKYNFLDYDGLEKLLQSINSYYASKELLAQEKQALSNEITTKIELEDTEIRALINEVRTEIEASISAETTARETAISEEASARNTAINDLTSALQTLTQAVNTEIEARGAADNTLTEQIETHTEQITALDDDLTALADDITDRLATLKSGLEEYIRQQIADIDLHGVKDIIIVDELPEEGVETYLYITSADHVIHQWTGTVWKSLGEDAAAEISALTDRVTIIEGQITDVNDRLDSTVDTETYEEFINSYTEKVEEIDQAIAETDQTVTGLETEVASKISGITVNDEPVEIEDGIAHITVSSGGGEGTDPELRADFEAFKATVNPQLVSFSNHLENWENPHHVSKADLELDQVNNTSDENKPISIATQAALDTKVDSTTHEEDLANKVSYSDIVDDLYTPDPERPLSANQGVEIDAAINEVKSSITALEAGLVFKGTVPSYNDLPVDAQNGFCYQIFSNTSDVHHGEIYAMTETGWVQIVASAQDMSSLIASQAEINKIITDYR